MNLKCAFFLSLLTASQSGVLSATFAADLNVNGQRLAATCAACHGTNGAVTGTSVPGLAGQSKDNIIASMKAFKTGTRQATIMQQLAKGYTEEQIETLAAFFSAQPAAQKK